jgi:hypothetical protein
VFWFFAAFWLLCHPPVFATVPPLCRIAFDPAVKPTTSSLGLHISADGFTVLASMAFRNICLSLSARRCFDDKGSAAEQVGPDEGTPEEQA